MCLEMTLLLFLHMIHQVVWFFRCSLIKSIAVLCLLDPFCDLLLKLSYLHGHIIVPETNNLHHNSISEDCVAKFTSLVRARD